ncbi:MAG: hypothetical protein CBC16_10710 [Verrucomicrobia bacterium TMED56]|jgi:prolyl 4-hydroxylase|nr:MAG: hypothetical protein CBC16_10710 [Verrucomicrobia bacterium TMED56]|tara:strand:- start:2764 stop:3339 length:576 start_codon:yes stop_codon:yes gene_type:complete
MTNYKKEKGIPYESFIYGKYMPSEICDDLLQGYKKNIKHAIPGRTSGGVNPDVKDSLDLRLHPNDSMFFEYKHHLANMIKEYQDLYETSWRAVDIVENIVLQYYKPGQGFKQMHCERLDHRVANRMLVFMTYLNTVKDAGTEFKFQKITTQAKKGLTLLWPSDYTHYHRGVINNKHSKYIITGWLSHVPFQ